MTASVADVFSSLKSGDVVTIHAKGHQPRKVLVHIHTGTAVLVHSKAVRSGHGIVGGLIAQQFGGGVFYYQPTLQQRARIITALEVSN